jgi:hypothetical protein
MQVHLSTLYHTFYFCTTTISMSKWFGCLAIVKQASVSLSIRFGCVCTCARVKRGVGKKTTGRVLGYNVDVSVTGPIVQH